MKKVRKRALQRRRNKLGPKKKLRRDLRKKEADDRRRKHYEKLVKGRL